MTLLFDTSAVVGLVERANQRARELITDSGERPFVSFATIAELHVGVQAAESDQHRTLRERTLRRARTFRLLPLDDRVLDHYAAACLTRIRGNDAWIAASARRVGASLVTEDETMATRARGIVDIILLETNTD